MLKLIRKLLTRGRRIRRRQAKRLIENFQLEPHHVAIDCGANVGDITAKLARGQGQVFAFEPNPYAFEKLQQRFADNERVVCFNQAVMGQAGRMKLYLHPEHDQEPDFHSTGSSVFASKINVDQANYHEVETIDIAAFIESISEPIDILKIDVEGAECEVLNRLIDTGHAQRIGHILVEMHEKGRIPEIVDDLAQLRKRVKKLGLKNINLEWS